MLTRTLLLLAALAAANPAEAQTLSGLIAPMPGQQVQKPSERSQILVRVNLVDTPAVVHQLPSTAGANT